MAVEDPGVAAAPQAEIPDQQAGPVPEAAPELEMLESSGLIDPVALVWLSLIIFAYCYAKNITFNDIKNKLLSKKSESNKNFHQEASESALNSREAYLAKLQEKIDSDAQARKAAKDKIEAQKRQDKLADKINKNEAILKGTHYTGPSNTCAEDEEAEKRKKIEEILRKRREEKKNNPNGASSSRNTFREEFNPLGSNSSDACRYRPSNNDRRSA